VKKIRTGVQRALHCRCGRGKVLALGMCATCYTLKRQGEEYFGGLREQVLRRASSLIQSSSPTTFVAFTAHRLSLKLRTITCAYLPTEKLRY